MNSADPNADNTSWPKAYTVVLSLFALEVVLLYLFTLRFS
jgi:hypothetical protein